MRIYTYIAHLKIISLYIKKIIAENEIKMYDK